MKVQTLKQISFSHQLRAFVSQRQRSVSTLRIVCNSSTPADNNEDDASTSNRKLNSTGDETVHFQFRGFSKQKPPQQPSLNPADALTKSLQNVSEAAGRVPQRNNIVLGAGENSEEKWRELDEQVNEYPGQRVFKAIGTGGDDFVQKMTACVEEVVGTVHQECVNSRLSSNGNYISVTVGPVWVETPEQAVEIYEKMKADGRMRFYI